MSTQTPAPHIAHILELLGPNTLLLGWPLGCKGAEKKWGSLTASEMERNGYLDSLLGGNIGVALGHVSDNIVSLDIDSDSELDEFISENPKITATLITTGKRGGNIWWRMKGDYPPVRFIKRNGRPWGEWRSNGAQTIIYGRHPDGPDYKYRSDTMAITIEFDQIQWPEGVNKPGMPCTQMTQTPQTVMGGMSECVPLSSVAYVYTIEEAVQMSVPNAPRMNHIMLCRLAGALRALEHTLSAALSDSNLRKAFDLWYDRSKPHLKPEQSRDGYLLEFWDAWRNVKEPLKESAVERAWKRAKAVSEQEAGKPIYGYTDENILLLLRFLRELQNIAGDKPFFLSPYTVQPLFGQNTHSTAAKWLGGLCQCGALTKVQLGDFAKRQASSYRFNPPKDEC